MEEMEKRAEELADKMKSGAVASKVIAELMTEKERICFQRR